MHKTVKSVVCAALLAACGLALADSAEVKISNVSMSAVNGQWFYWHPGGNSDAGVAVGLGPDPMNPSFQDAANVALGAPAAVSVTDGAAVAHAQLTARTGAWDVQGVTASVSVDASGGQGGWSSANVVNRSIWLGGRGTTLTVSANLDSLTASGPMSQGMVFIEICPNGICDVNSVYAEAMVDGTSGLYSGPSFLSASWSSPINSDGANVLVRFGLSAAAYSVSAVPEPSTYALWLAGICGVGVLKRRRSH
jgi:hypothetical protein